MLDTYGQKTYGILSKLIKFRFAKYLIDSGIEFGGIYKMTNLENEVEFFMLEVNNTQIRFKKPTDFLIHFMTFLRKNIEINTREYNRLTNRPTDEFTDEVGLEMRYKQVDYYIYQQTELLKAFRTHYDKIKQAKN